MIGYINRYSLKKLILILFLVGFLTYLSSFWNQFVWDDSHFFYQNTLTQDLLHIKQIFSSNTTAGAGVSSNYYRPLATLSFATDHQLWGWNPAGLHFTNTLFHCLNGTLLFLLLLLLRFGKIKSFLISVLFLIHPIQTEAVTYLSSRGDVFYLFFLLLSLLLFTIPLYGKQIRIVLPQKMIVLPHGLLLFFSILLFPLSVLSKEGALTTVPIYAGILFVFALQKKLSLRKLHTQYRNHFLVILVLIWLAIVYFGLRLTVLNFGNSLNYSGDQGLYGKNLFVRLLTFVTTLPQYVRLLLVPYPLYLERSTVVITSFFHPMVMLGLSLVGLGVFSGIVEIHKKRTGWIIFGLILIFANLASVSGIIPMTGLLRENWLYMPMIGFYMILFVLAQYFFLPFIKAHTKLFSVGFILYCLILIGMTIQQNYNWRNNIAYYEHNLRFTNTQRLQTNLGNAYIGKKDYKKALFHLEQAVKLDDSYPQTHYNIGSIYLLQGKLDQAEREFRTSLAIDPDYLFVYSPLITIYEKENQQIKALPYLKRLNLIYPNDLKLTIMYAQDLYKSGKTKEADVQFAHAIKLSHNDPKLIQAIAEIKKSGIDK